MIVPLFLSSLGRVAATSVLNSHRSAVEPALKVFNYDSWPFGNSTPADYKLWDWSKLTDVITPYLSHQRPDVYALAKKHNVNLVTDWNTLQLTDKFIAGGNTTQWREWIDGEVKERVVKGGMKGVSIDVEHMSSYCTDHWRISRHHCRELLTNFTCTLASVLHAHDPSATLSSALSLDPKDEDAGYDYRSMAPCLDYFLVMAYSTASPTTPGSTLQFSWVSKSMRQYASLGIGTEKLIPLLPWFGHNWPCKHNAAAAAAAPTQQQQRRHRIPVCEPLPLPPPPHRNRTSHHDVKGYRWEIGFGDALDLLDRFGPATFGPVWDNQSKSVVFEYVDDRSGTRHQVWYESPRSLQIKYHAFLQAGVSGVGMWIGSDFHRGDPQKSKVAAAQMWAAVPG
jgi:spore germination protein YaaH